MDIKVISVLGANGNMGSKISAIFACFGNAEVYMIGRSTVSLQKAVIVAKSSIRSDSIESHLHILTYDQCHDALAKSDFIFESVSEDLDLKKSIHKMISKYAKKDAIIASGTSGLSINELSLNYNERQRKRFLGLHFFNPPYNMTLCEVIPSQFTDERLVKEIIDYLENQLYRKYVFSRDTPAFIANRIGFQFINMAMIYAEKYKDKGGIDYIDAIIGPFTGRNMPPLVTAEFVGLDVHLSIVDNVYSNSNDFAHNDFKAPQYLLDLINSNRLGKKSGEGLYKTIIKDDGRKQYYVYDIDSKNYIEKRKYNFEFANNIVNYIKDGNYDSLKNNLLYSNELEAKICLEMLIKYIVYSIYIGNEIGMNVNFADDVMATGFNWIPPIALVDALGGKDYFFGLLKEKKFGFLDNVNINTIEELCPQQSNYDYKRFLKAKF